MTPLQELSIAQRNAKNYLVWKDILKEYTNPVQKQTKLHLLKMFMTTNHSNFQIASL